MKLILPRCTWVTVAALLFISPLTALAQTSGPPAPVIVGISPDTGEPNDGITSAHTFSVGGTAEPNAKISLKFKWSATILGTATADAWGHWSIPYTNNDYPLGSLDFYANATNSAGITSPDSSVFVTWIAEGAKANGMIPRATVGQAVDVDMNMLTTGSYPTGFTTFAVTGLPPGLALTNGHIKGTPTTAGIYRVTVSIANGAGGEKKTYSLVVVGAAPGTGGGGGIEAWQKIDIGAVGVAGSSSVSGTTASVSGSGSDIWGTSDEFHFAYRLLAGDGTIVARLTAQSNTDAWAKAGLMLRDALSPTANNVFLMRSPGSGTALQYRAYGPSETRYSSRGTSNLPIWLKLQRTGSTFTASESLDGTNWTQVGTAVMSVSSSLYVGLAVTSHNNSTLSTASFDSLTVTTGTSTGTPTTPPSAPSWSRADIGNVGVAGSDEASGNTITVRGAGADVWDSQDGFRFVYKTMTGDCTVEAKVSSLTNTNTWAKAGVMIRDSLTANSANVFACLTPSSGILAQTRNANGASTAASLTSGPTPPYWLRLVRTGGTITVFISTDGQQWTKAETYTPGIGGTALVGFAVTSHDTSQTATAVFTDPFIQ
jgi:regulation of enolase protein 1 (concanavalin A-like superfamily)